MASVALTFAMMNMNLSFCTLNISQTKVCKFCFSFLFVDVYSLVFKVGHGRKTYSSEFSYEASGRHFCNRKTFNKSQLKCFIRKFFHFSFQLIFTSFYHILLGNKFLVPIKKQHSNLEIVLWVYRARINNSNSLYFLLPDNKMPSMSEALLNTFLFKGVHLLFQFLLLQAKPFFFSI